MDSKQYVFIKEEEKIARGIGLPMDFVDRGKNCFVGIFYDVENNISIIGVPKYYQGSVTELNTEDENKLLQHIKLICEMIEHIRLDSNFADYRYNPYEDNEEVRVNKMNLAEFLIQDYLEYGLYGLFQNCYTTDGTGINDWRKTVETEIPIINDDMVIYDSIIGRKSQYNQNDIISKIHAAVIREVLGLLVDEKYQFVQIDDVEGLESWTDISQYLAVLYQRLNITFVERGKNLIKALIAWCGLTVNNEQYYIGSTSFEHVWEYAINRVFGNIDNTKSGCPFYYKLTGEAHTKYEGRGDLIPDSLRVEDNSRTKYFHIFDAKYYVWKEKDEELQIEYAPANSDISKQIGYYYYLNKLYGSKNRTFTNSFLAPASLIDEEDDWFSYWGYAQQNGTRDKEIVKKLEDKEDVPKVINLEKVVIFLVNPTRLYKMCIVDQVVSEEFLDEAFKKIGDL